MTPHLPPLVAPRGIGSSQSLPGEGLTNQRLWRIRRNMNAVKNGSPMITTNSWPRHLVKSVETRKRDVVIRITDWTSDRDEPAYDVEVYDRGVYDWNESKTFTTKSSGHSKGEARLMAIEFAQAKVAALVK